jgi:mono/diheme cytochrome c family protein
VRRLTSLALLALLAVAGAACSVPGGEITTATPDTVVGTLPASTEPTLTVPPEYANGDPAAGKEIFTAKCAACHTLSDAGASGTIGPNLDDAQPELELVIDRVVNGKAAMPPFKGQLTDKQIADVSAYVVQATSGG